ncbi:hypothetical protein [Phenylobacterium aquaticum]|uniref:hypothetical protein n=1 Tax=Phenylobacterium aquaticum TaxID=1763816 RepID=UPI001F5CD128|nr:hypothetical protein [Phenylobacterium aquaticum]MCI3134400.1 hypothetical protein [Phenylobacterium aquaticum]
MLKLPLEPLRMLNLELISRRLGQYGVVWLTAFMAVLAAGLIAAFGFHVAFVKAADLLLAIAFPILGLGLGGFVILTLTARESWLTKTVLCVLALLLALPLLWSPVLAVVGGAWATQVSIEYSEVYAGFRILVGRLLYALTEQVFGSPLVDAAWNFMQGFAGLVGFVSAVAHTLHVIRRLSNEPNPAASPSN